MRGAEEKREAYIKMQALVTPNTQIHTHGPPVHAKESAVRVHDMSEGDTGRDIVRNEEQINLASFTSLLTSDNLQVEQPLDDYRTLRPTQSRTD